MQSAFGAMCPFLLSFIGMSQNGLYLWSTAYRLAQRFLCHKALTFIFSTIKG